MKNNSAKWMLICAMLIFGTIGIFRQSLPVSSAFLVCFRGFSGSLFLVLLAAVRRKKIFSCIGKKRTLLLIFTGALIGINWVILFEAYRFTGVPTATLCYYMAPTAVILLSPIFLKERLTAKKLICAGIAVAGMIFISGVPESGLPKAGEAKGILFGIGAALLYAIVILLNKKIVGVEANQKTVIQLLSAATAVLPYLLLTENITEISLHGTEIVLLVILGILHTGIAFLLYFGGIDRLNAQTVAIFSYVDPISALLLSALILKESLTTLGIVGAIFILGAAFVSEITIPLGKGKTE